MPHHKSIKIALEHLEKQGISTHNVEGDRNNSLTKFTLPSLNGSTIAEHFWKIGEKQAGPVRELALNFASLSLPDRPKNGEWIFRAGWTRYEQGNPPESVDFPNEELLCFDVETLVPDSPFSVIACAASPTAWYSWVSPRLVDYKSKNHAIGKVEQDVKGYLIPLGSLDKERIIVGHHVSYDRIRIKEEYHFRKSGVSFLDTMALHIGVSGTCKEVPSWVRARWEANGTELKNVYGVYDVSCLSSLRNLYHFYFQKELDKTTRNYFLESTLEEITNAELFQKLTSYCAQDVEATHAIYQKVLPRFLKVYPHPVSFAGILHLGTMFLTTDHKWEDFIQAADGIYAENLNALDTILQNLAIETSKLNAFSDDHWLKQLNWSLSSSISKKLPGYPSWFRELFDSKTNQLKIPFNSKVAYILMKLNWNGYPLCYSRKHGWMYRVPIDNNQFKAKTAPLNFLETLCEVEEIYREDKGGRYYKLPYKNMYGKEDDCRYLALNLFVNEIEKGILRSEYDYINELLKKYAACQNWKKNGSRIKSFLVVYNDHPQVGNMGFLHKDHGKQGMILPQTLTMGTLTRRFIERDWNTSCGNKQGMVGGNYRSMIEAPEGFKIVSAKIDSLELWIASLIGDSQFGFHGATAMSWHILKGNVSLGTDLHSITARELNISHTEAQLIDYGRILGGTYFFASKMINKFSNSDVEDISKIISRVKEFYKKTEGQLYLKNQNEYFWHGGSESYSVNLFEEFNKSLRGSRTPILQSGQADGVRDMPVNWVVQSAAVDFEHLLLVSMEYFTEKYGIQARFMLSGHNQVQYLVKEKDIYRAALGLQVSHLWTRALFSYMLGIEDLPMDLAFLPSVNIGTRLVDEIQDSNQSDIDLISLSIADILERQESLFSEEALECKLTENIDDRKGDYPNITENHLNFLKPYHPPDDYSLFLELQSLSTEKEIKKLFEEQRVNITQEVGP